MNCVQSDLAVQLLKDNSPLWQWVLLGYARNTDVIVIKGILTMTETEIIYDDRVLLAYHPQFLFLGEVSLAIHGFIAIDPTDFAVKYDNFITGYDAEHGHKIIFTRNNKLGAIIICKSIELLLDGGLTQ